MLKKAAICLGFASFAIAGMASASDVRPATVDLKGSAQPGAAQLPAPAKARVAKKNKLAQGAIIGIVIGVGVVGGIAAAASSGGSSPS